MRDEAEYKGDSEAVDLGARRCRDASGVTEVAEIVADVRERGDAAIREWSERFGDGTPGRVESRGELDTETLRAVRALVDAVEAVHAAQRPADTTVTPISGIEVTRRWLPLDSVGIYVPSGLVSSLVMTAVPARLAGVERIAIATPRPSQAMLAIARELRIDELYSMGGPQAIAAFAYGTDEIDPVAKIVGPGNRWVTEAKLLVSSRVATDLPAGPSEVLVIADETADPEACAADLLAQGEHGEDSPLIVASPDVALLDRIDELVSELVPERPSVANAPLALVATRGLEAALTLADAVAPEHLELAFEAADENAARARIAGCVFVGAGGATAFGDYAAGSNHVLPTGGAARFGGPLGPGTFRRRTSVVTLSGASASALAAHVGALARAEGFPVHGESAEARGGA